MDKHWAKPPLNREQLVLYAERLDDIIEPNAPIRSVYAILQALDWEEFEQHYTGDFGQPPIHPMLVAGCILYGVMRGIRSSRQLEEATRTRVDFMWLLERRTIDHSTLAHFRKRFTKELKALNRQVVTLISKQSFEALEALETLIIDGTRVRANSNRHGARTAPALEKIIAVCVRALDERLASLAREDGEKEAGAQTAVLKDEVARLEGELAKYRKALAEAQRRDAKKEKDGKKGHKVRVPVTDPDATIVPNKEGGYAPNHTPVVAVDPVTGAIAMHDVMDGAGEADAVPKTLEEMQALGERAPKRILADSGFATGPNLKTLEEEGVDAYMPTDTHFSKENPANRPDPQEPVDEDKRDKLPRSGGKFARSAFIYAEEEDCFYCPMGKRLAPTRKSKATRTGALTTQYRCPGKKGCPLAEQCVKEKSKARIVTRDEYQDYRDETGKRMSSPQGKEIYKQRAPVVEGSFAVIKHIMGVRYFLLRGLENVRTEWSWVCLAYNMRKLLKALAKGALDLREDKSAKKRPVATNLKGAGAKKRPWPLRRLWSAQGTACEKFAWRAA